MEKNYATKYPLDIPHVTAVELPLNVKNTSRAIGMLGGKERIRMATNAQYRPSPIQVSSHSVDERNLELRLRNDPFHHPVQASVNKRERILVKVSVPRSCLPSDYHDKPGKYSIRGLLQRNKENNGPEHRVEPVSIVNKNYNFRAMADFQMSTKHNATVQKFTRDVLRAEKFEQTKDFYVSELTKKDEFRDPANYENRDHHLVPPPLFSAVRFPFDYKYKKNSFTVAVRDEQGAVKMAMKKDTKKLFTNTVDYHSGAVPSQPLPEIVAKYTWLKNTDLSSEWADNKLFECIQYLNVLFELKPVWLRKSLVDAVPDGLKSAVKEALPYVSYCYKNGPWRFCNVKLSVDPTADRSFWMYQSEYFRLRGLDVKKGPAGESRKVLPNTIAWLHPQSDVRVSESLLFTGTKLPHSINYQLGDILDQDVHRVIEDAQNKGEGHFFRESPDPQDGWITRQMMGTIRGVVRYKLRRLQHEQPIEASQIAKIIATDYTLKEDVSKTSQSGQDSGSANTAGAEDAVGAEKAGKAKDKQKEQDGEVDEEDEDGDEDREAGEEDDGEEDEEDDDEEEEDEQEGEENGEEEAENENEIIAQVVDEDAMDVDEPPHARFDTSVQGVSEDYVMNRVKQADEQSAAKLLSLVGLIKQDALNHAVRDQ